MNAKGIFAVIIAVAAVFVSGACVILAYAALMPAVQYSFGLTGLVPPFVMLGVAVAGPLYLLFSLTRLERWPLAAKLLSDLALAALLLFALYSWLSPRTERSILTPEYGQALSDACKGRPVARRPLTSQDRASTHGGAVRQWRARRSTRRSRAEWTPASPDKVELVACVGNTEQVVLETCRYQSGGDVTRYGFKAPVRVFVAATGEVLKEFTAHGDPPQPCAYREKSSVTSLSGINMIKEANLIGDLEPLAIGS